MNPDKLYSPAEISSLLGVSKSTLFRWEREGRLTDLDRDPANQHQRKYSLVHLRQIWKLQRDHFTRQYEWAATKENSEAMQAISEEISLRKFIAGHEVGLRELSQYEGLSEPTLTHLLRMAVDLGPGHKDFPELIAVVLKQSQALRKAGTEHAGRLGASGVGALLDSER